MLLGEMANTTGWLAVVNIAFLLFGVLIAWYALQVVRWEVFLKEAKGRPAAVLRLLLAVALGYLFSRFVNEYFVASTMIKQLF